MAPTTGHPQTTPPTTHSADPPDDARDPLTAALTEARSGNQRAYSTLYHDLHPRLLKQLRVLVGENDAQDVAAEAWIHIIAGLGDFRGGYRRFQAWARTIARRRAADHLRRTPLPIPLDPTDLPDRRASDDTEHDAIQSLATATVLRSLRALPPEQQRIILLRIIIGLDTPHTARILGKRPGSVRINVHRALKVLATQLPSSGALSYPPQPPEPQPLPRLPPPPPRRRSAA